MSESFHHWAKEVEIERKIGKQKLDYKKIHQREAGIYLATVSVVNPI